VGFYEYGPYNIISISIVNYYQHSSFTFLCFFVGRAIHELKTLTKCLFTSVIWLIL